VVTSANAGKLGRAFHYRAKFLQDWTISPDVPQGGHPEIIGYHRITSANSSGPVSLYAFRINSDGPDPALERMWYGRDCTDDKVLTFGQASARSKDITDLVVPTAGGALRSSGLSRAYEGTAVRAYDAGCDCVTDSDSGKTWTADGEVGAFVAADGERLAQGWKVNVGLSNFTRVLTDERISGPFLGTLIWNFAFAIGSTGGTFILGMVIASFVTPVLMRRIPGRTCNARARLRTRRTAPVGHQVRLFWWEHLA
jgi:hypothetical protein